jgi:histidyl-tRNA synthetase
VVIAGSEEMSKGVFRVKILSSGTQTECGAEELETILSQAS